MNMYPLFLKVYSKTRMLSSSWKIMSSDCIFNTLDRGIENNCQKIDVGLNTVTLYNPIKIQYYQSKFPLKDWQKVFIRLWGPIWFTVEWSNPDISIENRKITSVSSVALPICQRTINSYTVKKRSHHKCRAFYFAA